MNIVSAKDLLTYCRNTRIKLSITTEGKLRIDTTFATNTHIDKKLFMQYKQDLIFAINHYGFTKEELKKAAGEDWSDIENNHAAIKAFACGLPKPI
jgi:hypothetical protein